MANTPAHAACQARPLHLERIDMCHELESSQCGHCHAPLALIGEDISKQLDIEPARFFVIRHIRPQYTCCDCETVSAEAVAPAVIDGCLAVQGLLT